MGQEDPYSSVISGKLRISRSSTVTAESTPVQKEYEQTAAEKIFHKQRLERLAMLKQKMPEKTHQEAIKAFNKRLEETSEHYDIPKVGPG